MLCFCFRLNRNRASVQTAFLEGNHSVYQCVKRMIATHAYVLARVVYRTALTNDDVTGDARLTAIYLYA